MSKEELEKLKEKMIIKKNNNNKEIQWHTKKAEILSGSPSMSHMMNHTTDILPTDFYWVSFHDLLPEIVNECAE